MRFDRTTAERIESGRKTEHRIPRREAVKVVNRRFYHGWRTSAPELEDTVTRRSAGEPVIQVGHVLPVTVMVANANLGYRHPKQKSRSTEPTPRKEGELVCHVRVVDVQPALLHEINQNEAVAEGFKSVAEFLAYWRDRYREGPGVPGSVAYPIEIPVWVLRFHVDNTQRPRLLAEASDVNRGYTESPAMAVKGENEAVEDEWLDLFAMEAEQGKLVGSERAHLRRKRYELEQRLKRAREDADRGGHDISSPLRVIERQVEKIERRVYDGKAA